MRKNLTLLSILLSIALIAGCEQANEYAPPPPPKVTVALPQIQEVTDYLEFTGTTAASEWAEARARVSGILLSMHFEPGSWVKQGDLLFIIDPAEYQADLQAAEAELAGAKAQHNRAKIEYSRALKLFKEKAGAEAEVVKWRVEREVASAQILRAQAKLDQAQLNLGYTQVSAPIDGRVGRNQIEIGNLVGESEATVLTEITDSDPIYVYFNLNERDLLRVLELYRAEQREQGIDAERSNAREPDIPLYLGLANEQGYPHEGRYDFADSGVDAETGTLQLRGVFENPGNPPVLLPGLFTRIRMPLGKRSDMPLVAERAIGKDQRGTYLLVSSGENMVERRSVKTGQRIDGLIVIEEGLQADDQVIVKGIQKSRPGRAVEPQKVEMASLTTSALQQAAAQAEAAARAKRSAAGVDVQQPAQQQ